MGAFTSLLIKKTINFQMPVEKFENCLSEDPGYGFSIAEIAEHKYKILGNFSIGTLVITGSMAKVWGKRKNNNGNLSNWSITYSSET